MSSATFLSAAKASGETTFDNFPSSEKLKVPINPKARQNFLRDWIYPIANIKAEIKTGRRSAADVEPKERSSSAK